MNSGRFSNHTNQSLLKKMTKLTHASLAHAIQKSDAWLLYYRADSFLGLADRILIRFLYPAAHNYPDVQEVLSREPELLNVARDFASKGNLPMPDTVIIMWAIEQLKGQQLPQWRELLEPVTRAWANGMKLPEPHRSAGLYWANLLGWVDDWSSGKIPPNELYRMYHYTHQIYYATQYGVAPAPASSQREAEIFLKNNWQKYTDNADLTAEVLMAFLALQPLNTKLCADVASALISTQQIDGSFIVPGGERQHHHHSTCVAWLALSRLRDALLSPKT